MNIDPNELANKILKFTGDSETKYNNIDPAIKTKLEKEYFELCNFQRHHSTSRWTTTSFFIMLSFSIAYFSLQILSNSKGLSVTKDLRLGAYGLIFSACVYWLGFALFRRNKQLTYGIRKYLTSLSVILGFHYQEYIEEHMKKRRRIITILGISGVVYTIVIVLISFFYILESFGLI